MVSREVLKPESLLCFLEQLVGGGLIGRVRRRIISNEYRRSDAAVACRVLPGSGIVPASSDNAIGVVMVVTSSLPRRFIRPDEFTNGRLMAD